MINEIGPVQSRRHGRVLHVILSRPALKNAINEEMVTSLYRCLRDAAQDDTVGAVVLEGAGDAFCSGADIKNLALGVEHTRKYSTEVLLRVGAEAAMLLHEMPQTDHRDDSWCGGGRGFCRWLWPAIFAWRIAPQRWAMPTQKLACPATSRRPIFKQMDGGGQGAGILFVMPNL